MVGVTSSRVRRRKRQHNERENKEWQGNDVQRNADGARADKMRHTHQQESGSEDKLCRVAVVVSVRGKLETERRREE